MSFSTKKCWFGLPPRVGSNSTTTMSTIMTSIVTFCVSLTLFVILYQKVLIWPSTSSRTWQKVWFAEKCWKCRSHLREDRLFDVPKARFACLRHAKKVYPLIYALWTWWDLEPVQRGWIDFLDDDIHITSNRSDHLTLPVNWPIRIVLKMFYS